MITRRNIIGSTFAGLASLFLPKSFSTKQNELVNKFEVVIPPTGYDGWGELQISCKVEMNDSWFEQLYSMLKKSGRVSCREDVRLVIEHALKNNVCADLNYNLLVADRNPPTLRATGEPYWKLYNCADPYWKKAGQIRADRRDWNKTLKAYEEWFAKGRPAKDIPSVHYPPKWV